MSVAVIEPQCPAELESALERCVDTLLTTTLRSAGRATWPTWGLASDGTAERVSCGRSDVYSGDAGIAYALTRLAGPLGLPEALDAALAAQHGIAARAPLAPGWITGTLGLADLSWPEPAAIAATDLTNGVAAALLMAVRRGASATECRPLVEELGRRAIAMSWGSAWPDPSETGDAARPLCGLAHGASGIVLALAEAATRHELADQALSLADAGLRWESTWFDPIHGGWPDLREGVSWPALWCHGAAGSGLVRLRLIELCGSGQQVPWPEDGLRAEAEVAVQACGSALEQALDQAADGFVGHGGLTLCHGLGGPLLTLAEASRVLGAPEHLEVARQVAAAISSVLPDDPADWPSGYRGADGDLGLMTGVAGTALVLAALARPAEFPGVGLLDGVVSR